MTTNLMELHQTPLYDSYIQKLGWKTDSVDGSYIYYRSIPFMGGLAKLQRITTLPSIQLLVAFINNHGIRTIAIEPASTISQAALDEYISELRNASSVKINISPYLATKTIIITLSQSEHTLFNRFSEAKRRAVRRAQKHALSVRQSQDISLLIRTKASSAGLFGSITTYGLQQLWDVYGPNNADILLAFSPSSARPLGCVLLVYSEDTCFYWIAGASREGKKLFAPTLLVWEALRLAKKHGSARFDFVGVWDERLPKENVAWKGFTKFKEGFGGDTLSYPIAILR